MFTRFFSRVFKEFFSLNVYKGSQGRIARRLTFLGLSLVFILGAYSVYSASWWGATKTALVAAVVAAIGVWSSFRVVNYSTFADFLVSVEAEMTKVSWPAKKELYANTKIVLIFMFLFTALIFAYDVVFRFLFSYVS